VRRFGAIVIVVTIAIAVVAFVPFETTVVPVWKLRVIDENGKPYANQRVNEFWANYSLELGAAQHGDERWTDQNGHVEFPQRTIRMSLLGRTVRRTLTAIGRSMHGSTGIEAYLASTGPQGITNVHYDPGKVVPDILELPRYEKISVKP